MTMKTGIRKNRPDIAVEKNGTIGLTGQSRRKQQRQTKTKLVGQFHSKMPVPPCRAV